MRRREFVGFVGGATIWPLAAQTQERDRVRRIGVITATDVGNADSQTNIKGFHERLRQLGWTEGRNMQMFIRWGGGDMEGTRKAASDLLTVQPDVILVSGTAALRPMLDATRSVPIVFTNVADPVGAGFVESLARPGGNTTGFMQFEYNVSGKWLELLKEAAPNVARVAVIRDPAITAGVGQFAVIQSVAAGIGVEVFPIDPRDAAEIERGVAGFARLSNGGLIVTASALSAVHRELIITLAARHRLPAIYYRRGFVVSGGLVSYGYDVVEHYQKAATYVDRILKGEKPADLPVQAPTKYELVINIKTANALGLTVPPSLLARADEVIE